MNQVGQAPLTAEEARRRYVDFIRIQAMDANLIGREEEKRLLQEGMVRFNLSLEEARGLLLATANEQGYVLQRGTEEEIRELITVQAQRNRGRKLSRAEFDQAVAVYRAKVRNAMPDQQIRSRVKAIMNNADIKPKRAGWLIRSRRWFKSIPEE